MTKTELKNLNQNDIVWVVTNTGSAGIFEYQYLGLQLLVKESKTVHLFASANSFLSTLLITYNKEDQSRNLKRIFLAEQEAIDYRNKLLKEEENERY